MLLFYSVLLCITYRRNSCMAEIDNTQSEPLLIFCNLFPLDQLLCCIPYSGRICGLRVYQMRIGICVFQWRFGAHHERCHECVIERNGHTQILQLLYHLAVTHLHPQTCLERSSTSPRRRQMFWLHHPHSDNCVCLDTAATGSALPRESH